MNIINRICAMHANDYNIISNAWLEPVHLEFGASIPAEFRKQLENMMDRLDLEVDPYECDLNLQLDLDAEGVYRLSRSGELLYRFANRAPGFHFPDYSVAEAVAWTVYAMVSQNEKKWLHNINGNIAHGAYVSCHSFSAKQQAVAYRIMRSVNAQSVSEMPENWVKSVLEQMLAYAEQFAAATPRFSSRPIIESACKAYRGKPVEKKLEDLAKDLFGNSPFEEEVRAYCAYVKQSEAYAEQVGNAHKQLTRIVYNLPIMTVSRFFMEFNEAIVALNDVSLSQLDDILDKQVRFSLTPEKLKNAFTEADNLCTKYAGNTICQEFLRDVLEATKQELDDEQLEARKVCRQMRRVLSQFCFMQENFFAEIENAPLIGWKQLMALQERDLSITADIRWDADTMIHLQRNMMNPEEPSCWLCAQPLQEAVKRQLTTDQFGTKGVPLIDQRCVIALWVRECVE